MLCFRVVVLALPLLAFLTAAATPSGRPRPAAEAKRIARAAAVDFKAGDFEAALQGFTKAYKLTQTPELFFDLGQCNRALHRWERAAFFYRGYLRERCVGRQCKEVLALLAEVEARASSPPPVMPPPPVSPVAPDAPSRPLLVAAAPMLPAPAVALAPPPRRSGPPPSGWILGGATVVAAAGWVVTGGAALVKYGQLGTLSASQVGPAQQSVHGLAVASDLFLVAAVALGAGTALAW